MAFVTHLDASAQANRRDATRRPVDRVFAAFSGRDTALTIVLHDISETGFRAEFASELEVGDEVRLRLGRGEPTRARVMWREGWDHGCRFVAPLTEEEVEAAVGGLRRVASSAAGGIGADAAAPPPRRRGGRRLMLLIVAAVLIAEAYLALHFLR